jgi:hypothetical protein
MFAGAEHVRRHADGVAAGLQRLDRRARRDSAHHGDRDRAVAIVLGGRRTDRTFAKRAFDDARRETATAIAASGAGELRQLDDFDGAGAVGQATDEAALFQRGDEAVDTRLRAQVERVLHFIEGWRHASLLQPFIDETQKFILFARKHREHSPGLASFGFESSGLAGGSPKLPFPDTSPRNKS